MALGTSGLLGVYILSKAGLDSCLITFSVFENKHSTAETFLSDVITTGGEEVN